MQARSRGALLVLADVTLHRRVEVAQQHFLRDDIEPDAADVKKDWTYEQPTQLFWNRGDGTFADVSAQ